MKESTINIELYCPFNNNRMLTNALVYLLEEKDRTLFDNNVLNKPAFYIQNTNIIVLNSMILNTESKIKKAFFHELHHFIYNKSSNIVIHRYDTKNIMWYDVDEMCSQSMEYAEEFINIYKSIKFKESNNKLLLNKLDSYIIKQLNSNCKSIIVYGRRKIWDT